MSMIHQPKAAANGVSLRDVMAKLDALAARNAELEAKLAQRSAGKAIGFKVSEKGALSVYGLGRFPVTLYRQQWERLLGAKADIEQFIQDHSAQLSVKE